MGNYGFGRGGWLQAVPVVLSVLLAIGIVRAGLQISECTGSYPRTHASLAVIALVPALLPLVSTSRWMNAGLGLLYLAALFIVLGVNGTVLEIAGLLPSAACGAALP